MPIYAGGQAVTIACPCVVSICLERLGVWCSRDVLFLKSREHEESAFFARSQASFAGEVHLELSELLVALHDGAHELRVVHLCAGAQQLADFAYGL